MGVTCVKLVHTVKFLISLLFCSCMFRCFVVLLGNHDYRGNVLAQLSHVLTKFDSRWLCLRSFVLNTSNNVDFYVSGHDHCLEHIIDSKSQIPFLTSGGCSKAWRRDVKQWDPEKLKLYYDRQGFMSMEMNKKEAKLVFYDVYGNVLHKWSRSKELDLTV
ncbi:hypothetical protein UlMin_037923 [Ulmus minor]